jgi:hypothetical protein
MEGNRSSWARLQNLLEGLKPGDVIRVGDIATETGLEPATCTMVLDALARVELFTPQEDGTYLRRRIVDDLERQR